METTRFLEFREKRVKIIYSLDPIRVFDVMKMCAQSFGLKKKSCHCNYGGGTLQ